MLPPVWVRRLVIAPAVVVLFFALPVWLLMDERGFAIPIARGNAM